MIQWVKEPNGRSSSSMLGTLNLHFQKELLAPPNFKKAGRVKDLVASKLKIILRVIAIIKNKGVTGDHVVFSFISRRVQPLQLRKHPAFRYEGTQDSTRMSPKPMAQSELVKRCCKVLDNFDKSLILPTLFWAQNPPENAWVCILKTMSSTYS